MFINFNAKFATRWNQNWNFTNANNAVLISAFSSCYLLVFEEKLIWAEELLNFI